MSKFGKNVAAVTKTQLKCHVLLEDLFGECVGLEQDEEFCNLLYHYWIEKYCNARIKDTFLISAKKLEIANSNKITCESQNLRDGLKTDFVKQTREKLGKY